MRQIRPFSALAIVLALGTGAALAQTTITNLRDAPLAENASPPPMRAQLNTDLRQVRAYPEQPPVIPHSVEGYQVDINANKCLTCHARAEIGASQAPMVSVTHYIDREGQVLAQVSPRRYFCTQCHVAQHPDEPGVGNTFVDVDTLLQRETRGGADSE